MDPKEPKEPKESKEPKEPKETKEPKEPKEAKEPKENEFVSRETYDKLERKNKELEDKIKNLEQTILHANVEEKNENPFKGFSRYDK